MDGSGSRSWTTLSDLNFIVFGLLYPCSVFYLFEFCRLVGGCFIESKIGIRWYLDKVGVLSLMYLLNRSE